MGQEQRAIAAHCFGGQDVATATDNNEKRAPRRQDDKLAPRSEAPERHLVVFSLDDQRYALPLAAVQRCMRVVAITPLPGAPSIVLGIVDLGGSVLPVIDTRRRFHRPSRDLRLSDHLIVATTSKRTVALLVDETKGVLELSAESSAPADGILPGLELVAGAMKLEDGLVLIHDLERLLSLEDERAIDTALIAAAEAAVRPGSGQQPDPKGSGP